ncbi:MAG TPA: tripartite tricarboxylate transporter substrate binding protein [Thermodesulfobacteriota bacterium]
MRRPGRILTSLAVALVAALAAPAAAAEFPSAPIRLVTWSSVGGGGDVLARQLAEPLSKHARVPVVVVNRPGGGGATAMEYVSSQPADGYTLLVGTASGVITPHVAGSRYSLADFKPVIRIQTDPEAFLVRADAPWKTLEDVLGAAKAQPSEVKFGGAFLGSLDSLLTYEVFRKNDLRFSYVPFDGGAEAMTALLGGHVAVLMTSLSEVTPQVEAGKVRIVGIASPERLKTYPDVPTLKEMGMDVVGEIWRGLVAPKDTPDDVVKKLHDLVQEAIKEPSFVKYTEEAKLLPGYLPPQAFGESIRAEFTAYGNLVKEMGVRK